ncbi:ABC transporter permease [Brachybacterium fresconis]|uniref:Oligopeptide transport system permease protein n=1 Tax=Brachybacterium fresconis TaxID=173363 RepID=A0ABS4YPW4_9MICO|nr:ABC transporter permease [Brachybacterium fresconis]MBP2410842.1 oligopeptide transport system permease protein [Brachybacterium fresconis]
MTHARDTSGATVRRGQEHFVAPVDETPLLAVDTLNTDVKPRSLWSQAWRDLRRNPLFIVSAILIAMVVTVAVFPRLFTDLDPYSQGACNLADNYGDPEPGHPFGFDRQGCDVYSRVIFGARPSVIVGVVTTIGVFVLGGLIGSVAGWFGGWIDAILSRLTDIFFAIPLILAAIVVGQLFELNAITLALILVAFGWTAIARIARGSVMSVMNSEFIAASKALGATSMQNLFRHVVPNAIAPVIVTAMVNLGVYIVLEATLSFLGVGLPASTISWGTDISTAQGALRVRPELLFYPSGALAITILSFIMLGDAVRDALDPKTKKR